MMKKLLTLCVSIFLCSTFIAQTFPSSCEGTQDVIDQYYEDAQWLNVAVVTDQELPEQNEVNLSPEITDSILNALVAVYNVEGIPERDSVVDIFNILTFPIYSLNSLVIGTNNDVLWMQELLTGSTSTSSSELNALISDYDMIITGTNEFTSTSFVTFQTGENYNISALAQEFLNVPDILYADPNGYVGDGDRIDASLYPEYVELNYSKGWGDCPAGCICRRHWIFHIYQDCSVQFIESYGCSITPTGIDELEFENLVHFPNPFHHEINFSNLPQGTNYKLINAVGKTVQAGTLINGNLSDLENLSQGIYFLQLFYENKTSILKVIKN